MLRRFLAFLVGGFLLVAFGFLFYLNPGAAEFRLTPARSYTLPLPLLLILAFLVGAALVFLLALLRETQWSLADRRRRRLEKRRERQRSALAAGRQLHRKGRSDQARTLLRRALESPDGLEASLLLAETALDSDRPNEAMTVLEEARARYRDDPDLLALAAEVYRRLGQTSQATLCLEKAVGLDPQSPRLVERLRDSYLVEGRAVDALRAGEQLLTVLRQPEQILLEQSRLQGLRYEAALTADGDAAVAERLRAVVGRHPDFLPAVVSLGDCLRSLGRTREAARVWVRAAQLRPAPVLLKRIEELYLELGRPDRVLSFYRRLVTRGEAGVVRLRLVQFLISQGKIDEAAAELETADSRLAELPEPHALWAEIHRRRGNAELALQSYRRSLDAQSSLLPLYACRECGRGEPQWSGRCPGCGAWDSFQSPAEAAL